MLQKKIFTNHQNLLLSQTFKINNLCFKEIILNSSIKMPESQYVFPSNSLTNPSNAVSQSSLEVLF